MISLRIPDDIKIDLHQINSRISHTYKLSLPHQKIIRNNNNKNKIIQMAFMAQPAIATLLSDQTGAFRPFVTYPGDNCCYLFDDVNFDNFGRRDQNTIIDDFRKLICHDGTRTTIDLHPSGWGNKVSSYMCGKNVWYDFCRNGTNDCVGGDRTNSGAGFIRNY